jgi:hypothetical protein
LQTPHVNYCTMFNIVYYCIYFSSLQINNKPCEGVTKPAFILGTVTKAANRDRQHEVLLHAHKLWTKQYAHGTRHEIL